MTFTGLLNGEAKSVDGFIAYGPPVTFTGTLSGSAHDVQSSITRVEHPRDVIPDGGAS